MQACSTAHRCYLECKEHAVLFYGALKLCTGLDERGGHLFLNLVFLVRVLYYSTSSRWLVVGVQTRSATIWSHHGDVLI